MRIEKYIDAVAVKVVRGSRLDFDQVAFEIRDMAAEWMQELLAAGISAKIAADRYVASVESSSYEGIYGY